MQSPMRNKKLQKFLSLICLVAICGQFFIPRPVLASGNCGVGDGSGPAITPKYGGVSLDKAAVFLADMSDITASYYDAERNQLVFVGTKNTTLPKFDKDDLAVAIRSVIFNNTNPAVSIDFKDLNNSWEDPMMKVSHYGGIEDTNFGKVLLEADYQLKRYIVGYDENGSQVSTSVPGY